MADKIENPNIEPATLSPEELAAKRAEITAYYEEHIPALQVQLEYENLLRDIEKTRAERLQAQMFITKSMAEPPDMPQRASSVPPVPPVPPPSSKAAKDFAKVQKEVSSKQRTLKKKADATK